MTVVERTSAGLQTVIPGCERRTLPKSTTRVDERPGFASLLQTFEPSRTTRKASGCTFAAATWSKAITEKWLVRLIVTECSDAGIAPSPRYALQPEPIGRGEGWTPRLIGRLGYQTSTT
jgi:hypothetical protein